MNKNYTNHYNELDTQINQQQLTWGTDKYENPHT